MVCFLNFDGKLELVKVTNVNPEVTLFCGQFCLEMQTTEAVTCTWGFFSSFVTFTVSCIVVRTIAMLYQISFQVFYKKGALKNSAKLTGKQLCQSLFLNLILYGIFYGRWMEGGYSLLIS